MRNSYHNTVKVGIDEEATRELLAKSQDEIVLSIFRAAPLCRHTPETIHSTHFPRTPLTSVRRAFTNLKNRGLIRKTGEQQPGLYGHLVNVWELDDD